MKTGTLVALFALTSIAASQPAAAETRALIVGVSNYEHLDPSKHLWAPKNDVKEIEDLLQKRGVKKSNMTLIADGISAQNPTRQAIMDAMRALIERSKRGDFVIVYFSGHGSYQPDQPVGDPRHDEEDGYDQVFLPYDVEPTPLELNAKEIKNAIIDDELGEFADALREKGVDLWFILDSCYSGTGLRAAGQFHDKMVDPSVFGLKIDKAPDPKKDFVVPEKPATASRSLERPGRQAFFPASRRNEPSREIPVPGSEPAKDPVWRSAFTHTMVTVMTRSPKLTYRQVIKAVNDIMAEPGSHISQASVPEGDLLDRPPFGHDAVQSAVIQWPVRRDAGIDAGVADGVEKGAIVALFDNPNAKDSEASGYAQVSEASATEAKISPIREYPCPLVDGIPVCRMGGAEIITRAHYARLVEPPLDFAFDVSSPRFLQDASPNLRARAAEVFDALRTSGRESKQLHGRVRFDDKAPDFVWWVSGEGFRIAPASNDPAKLDNGAAVDLAGNEPLDEVKSKTLRILLRAYRVEQLRRLATKDAVKPEDRPRLKVDLHTAQLRYDDGQKKCTPADPQAEMKAVEDALVADPCMHLQIDIRNESSLPRFVNVFLIDNDWNFVDFCAQRGKDSTLEPGPNAVRSCTLKYGPALPGGSDFARYKLVIFSTPQRQNASARSFDEIMNLNNVEGGASRGASDLLAFDDGLTDGAEGARSVDKNAATVTWMEWDLDHRANK